MKKETRQDKSSNRKQYGKGKKQPEDHRILSLLNIENAFAAADPLGENDLVNIYHKRKGVSICAASVGMDVIKRLESRALLKQEKGGHSGRIYWTLTDTGRARQTRSDAPAGVDPHLAQHMDLEQQQIKKDEIETNVLINNKESPLAWLSRRLDSSGNPFIGRAQLQAGERFRRDLDQAQIMPKVTANWSASVASGGRGGVQQHVTDLMIAARQRVDKAVEAVGSDYADLLIDVCGFLKGLKVIESERGWPPRSAKVILDMALNKLSDHYGFGENDRKKRNRPNLRHWGTDDFRPTITDSGPDELSG